MADVATASFEARRECGSHLRMTVDRAMSLIGRLFVILFALLLAAVATAIVATFALLIFAFQQLSGDSIEHVLFWGAALFGTGVAAFSGFLPTLIGIALAEA